MDYRERPPAAAIAGLIKCFWTLEAKGQSGAWIVHEATPDGCIEIIRREAGRSRWGGEQPTAFVAGLNDRAVAFEISADAHFTAVRLWPWAWAVVSDLPIAGLRNRWMPADAAGAAEIGDLLADPDAAEHWLADRIERAPAGLAGIGMRLAAARSVAEMREATGLGARALQRWFTAQVGVPPRHYLRLLRFQDAFAEVGGEGRLADQAATHGFADQAHMAREFRTMAGVPAGQARRRARGPFLR